MTINAQNMRPDDLARLQRSHLGMASWQAARQHVAARRYQPAITSYQNLLKQYPGAAPLWAEMAYAAWSDLDFAMAGESADRCKQLASGNAELLNSLGNLYSQLGRMNEAEDCFQKAVAADPASAPARFVLSSWFERTRRLDAAWEMNDALLAKTPQDPRALCFRAFLLHRRKQNAEAEAALHDLLVNETAMPKQVCGDAWQLRGVVLDALGQYTRALDALQRAKEIRASLVNVAGLEQMFDTIDRNRRQMLSELTADTIRRWRGETPPAATPAPLAFLGGAPRSGTTLLEQIIGAHPDIQVFDEPESFTREILGPMRLLSTSGLTLKIVDETSANARAVFVERYFKSLLLGGTPRENVRLLLDKNPSTTAWLPLWLRLFPQSKIVIALRDPRDVLISCFFQNVTAEWGVVCYRSLERTSKFYSGCLDVWLRLRDLGGFDWIESRYEDVVANLEREGRRVMDFLGVQWDPAQATFFEFARSKYVSSPTYTEVTQPVYRRAVKRWENYAAALAPLEPVLERYLKALGYTQ